jgi:predicted nucleotide-binding protein (sugar kinase/HSP70/actin superfamily)
MSTRYVETIVPAKGSLIGRTLYVPQMSIEVAATVAAVYRSIGVNGQVSPDLDAHSLDLARQYTIGEECFPEIVTLGSFLRIIEEKNFEPEKTAFMMPTTDGPCRFGQYKNLLEKILKDKGLEETMVVSPTSEDGYEGVSDHADDLFRLTWWAFICADGLRKLLLLTRPYENNVGDTDIIHSECLKMLCGVIERQGIQMKEKFEELVHIMEQIEKEFSKIEANYTNDKLLIGVVGEIYCRLDNFSNAHLIRRIEKYGGEAWLASVAEWAWYANFIQKYNLKLEGKRFSKTMLGTIIKNKIQQNDEHKLFAPLHNHFAGYEDPKNIKDMINLAVPYLPYWGCIGEMVLNVGGSIYLYSKGVDGIIDISPFTCMNGITCEAIYPRVSRDYNNIPIRNFYFDGTESDYDRDIEIFLELAMTYKRRKKTVRIYPSYFNP